MGFDDGSDHYVSQASGGLIPTIYLARGQTYEFVNASGHPFHLQQALVLQWRIKLYTQELRILAQQLE